MRGQKQLEMVPLEGGTTQIKGKCVFTGEEYSCTVPTDGLLKWLNEGVRIQNALPGVDPDDREFLISGISPAGWKKTFGEP